LPDAGDTVEHFAFGVCEVVKSEGDRLHVRNEKEQRVREISIEKLKVSLLSDADENGKRRYKLERKL